MVTVKERYVLKGMTSFTTYASGEIRDCKLNKYNEFVVGKQTFVPRYTQPDERRKDGKSVAFYEDGSIRSIALEVRTEILTSVGFIHAEFVSFYEDGSMNSLFPLNGQLGFGWSEEDEEQLLEEIHFDLPVAAFTTKIIGLRFHQSGCLKSLILWPKRTIEISTPIGLHSARIGFRLYEDGSLESFEPAFPTPIDTRIGTIIAFDQNAVGMDADFNSVSFYPDGRLRSLSTNSDIVVNKRLSTQRTIIYQQLSLDMITGHMVKIPVIISFAGDTVCFDNGADKQAFGIEDAKFLFLSDGRYQEKKCSPGSDCSGCGASCM